MNRRTSRVIQGALLGATVALLGAMTTPAYAQLHRSPAASNGTAVAADVFKVQSFNAIGTGVLEVRTVNPTSTPILCAMEYVFDTQEEEQECCGCVVTNDGLRTQQAGDLLGNSANGEPSDDGIVKIVSSLPNTSAAAGFCNPALAPSLTPALRPSMVHFEEVPPPAAQGSFGFSVQSFDDAPLDQTELNNLVSTCAFIHVNGSGTGRCTCGQGDVSPAQPHAGR